MPFVIVQHRVKDFDSWKSVFDEHGAIRNAHGARGYRLFRPVDDPHGVIIVNEFATLEGARAFMSDPSLPAAMARGGVEGSPNVWLSNEVESVSG